MHHAHCVKVVLVAVIRQGMEVFGHKLWAISFRRRGKAGPILGERGIVLTDYCAEIIGQLLASCHTWVAVDEHGPMAGDARLRPFTGGVHALGRGQLCPVIHKHIKFFRLQVLHNCAFESGLRLGANQMGYVLAQLLFDVVELD